MKPNEHKFTDEEVIEALECCRTIDGNDCSTCPYNGGKYEIGSGGCSNHLVNDAIDLINRQKAEIERLQGALTAEERHNELTMQIAQKAIKNAKAEAIKEYLTMVLEKKDIAGHFEPRHGVVAVSVLEACAKEMMEGK